MATHITKCIVCGADVYCSEDVHALGCGGPEGHGGCESPPYIEFCSLEHAEALQRRLAASIENYSRVVAENGR